MSYILLKIAGSFGLIGFFILFLFAILNKSNTKNLITKINIPWISDENNYDIVGKYSYCIAIGLFALSCIFL